MSNYEDLSQAASDFVASARYLLNNKQTVDTICSELERDDLSNDDRDTLSTELVDTMAAVEVELYRMVDVFNIKPENNPLIMDAYRAVQRAGAAAEADRITGDYNGKYESE